MKSKFSVIGLVLAALLFSGLIFSSTAFAQVPQISLPLVPSSVVPGSVPAPGSGLTITVNGTGFSSGSVVNWNGSPRPTTFISSTGLRVLIAPEDVESAGTAWVTVTTPGAPTSNVAYFQVTNPTTSVSFQASNYAVYNGPRSFAVGDFNRDGKLDLAVANYGGGNYISVLLGNGDGTFQPAVNYFGGPSPYEVRVGDFNDDGRLDLAVADAGNSVSILLGNGDGTFQAAVTYPTGNLSTSVAIGDFNGDGKLDLVVTNLNSDFQTAQNVSLSVLLGNGDGTFQPAVNCAGGAFPIKIAAGDFNGDGKLDLAVTLQGQSNVSVLLGNGDGSFQTPVYYPTTYNPQSIAVGDFNGDGKLDLVAGADSYVNVLLGNGDGTFQPAVSYATPSTAYDVRVADLNGDGKLDLAVANLYANSLSVLFGNGDGTFQAVVNFATGNIAVSLAVGDFNSDGQMDLAVANFGSNNVSILLQPTPASVFATLGSNTFTGNQIVNGVVTATSFVGDGSGLTGVIAASANIANLANYATSAGDAATLGGFAPSAFAPASGSLSYVSKSGDTMSGTLNLVANGLIAGGNQLVLSGGNVGIGTASPEGVNRYTSLHIDNALSPFGGSFLQLSNSGTGFKSRIVGDPNGLLLCGGCGGNTSPAPVRIKAGEVTSGTDSHIYILTNGNVGIGTVTPGAKLDVNGTANFSGLVNFAASQTFPGTGNGTITGVTAGTGLLGGGTTGNVTLNNAGLLSLFAGTGLTTSGGQTPTVGLDTTFTDSRYLQLSGGTLTGTLNLPADGLTAGGNELVLSSGNVGIGTTTPENLPGYRSLHVDSSLSGFGGAFLELTHSTTNQKGRVVMDDHGFLLNAVSSAPVKIKAGSTFNGGTDPGHIYISPSGAVGIGTGTPAAQLDVNGTANFSGLVTFASGQTFPGTGTITGVTAGNGLSGGGTSGNVSLTNTGILALTAGTGINTTGGQTPTLSLNTSFTDGRYAQLGTANTFTANQTVPNLTANGTITSSLANFSGSNNTQIVSISQTGNNGTALAATAGGNASTGVSGRGTQFGVYGNGLYGVRGDGIGFGVWGVANITGNSYGVVGYGNYGVKGDGSTYGVYADASTYGVYAIGHSFGVYGTSDSTGGIAGAFNASGGAKILSGQNAGSEVLSVASDGSLSTSGNLVATGSTTIGNGTPITRHLSTLFSNVAFNVKLSPTTCTTWSNTVSGATDGDTVAVGMGSSLMSANIVYSAWATSGGVTIRICNPTGSPTNLGSGNIRVDVWKH